MLKRTLKSSRLTNFVALTYGFILPVTLTIGNLKANEFCTMEDGACDSGAKSALQRAIEVGKLELPSRKLKVNGEFEGRDFWQKYESLFTEAWNELPKLHPEIYSYDQNFKDSFINPELRKTFELLREAAGNFEESLDESELWMLLPESKDVKGVYEISNGLFTEKFLKLFLEELEHLSSSGIPIRRPNGMNRYGAILGEIGFQSVFDALSREYISPIVQMLYPDYISDEDADENYAFIVDYQKDSSESSDFDVELKEHRDSSVATLNVCLGYDNFTDGNLLFLKDEVTEYQFDRSKGQGEVKMRPGLSILHKGQHRHAALPITGGRRVNLIMWIMGQGGYVRIAPYSLHSQMTGKKRWNRNKLC